MSLGKALLSIARFGLKKIVKPAAEEYGPDILADMIMRPKNRPPEPRDSQPDRPSREDL